MKENKQPIEKLNYQEDQIEVIRVWKTIQGEGPFAGCPAIFVRLAGCTLLCPACDTEYTEGRFSVSPKELLQIITPIREDSPISLVVLTGGEPFRQNLDPLVESLLAAKYQVQIETNGVVWDPRFRWYDRITIVCSPKSRSLAKGLLPHVDVFKYVIQSGKVDASDGLPTSTLGRSDRVARPPAGSKVIVQPLDEGDREKNNLNLSATLSSCFRFGYPLCLQTHKIIGMD